MRGSGNARRTSYAFLTEMLWVCAFFLISACIFVLVFAKSEQISRDAEILNQAVQAASNAMEDTFALYEGTADSLSADSLTADSLTADNAGSSAENRSAWPDNLDVQTSAAVQNLAASYGTGDYFVEIVHATEDTFLSVTVKIISTRDHSEIYSLDGNRFLAGISGSANQKEGVTP